MSSSPAPSDRHTDVAATVDDLRSRLAGWHFSKESLTDGEREILAVAEAVRDPTYLGDGPWGA